MLVVIPSGGPRQQFRAAVADASTRRQQLRHRGAAMTRIARVAVGDANLARACVRRARRGDVDQKKCTVSCTVSIAGACVA
jgi:hypothetical protein